MTSFSRLAVLSLAFLVHDPLDAQESNPTDWVTIAGGSLPIVVAAPHGGREEIPGVAPRLGIGVPQFAVQRDNNTAELAEMFAAKLAARLGAKPFLVIARFERKQVDANRAASAAYEEAEAKPFYDFYHAALAAAVADVRRRWGGGLLLDLHGQAAERDTIFRGTDNGRSVAALEQRFGRESLAGPASILAQMAVRGYKVEPGGEQRERRYTGGYTTRSYGSHRTGGIDAIQLEFGANLRSKTGLERTADNLAAATEIFSRAHLALASAARQNQPAAQP